MKTLLAFMVAATLTGCLGTGLDTPGKKAVAFCNSFAGTIGTMTLLNQAGNLSESDIMAVDDAVVIIEPYCTSETLTDPTSALLGALDRLIIIQLTKR